MPLICSDARYRRVGSVACVYPFFLNLISASTAPSPSYLKPHVQYVLRITYREVRIAQDNTAHLVRPTEVDLPEGGVGDNCAGVRPAVPSDDPGASELVTLAASSRGLVQRTRVLSKRLNSLCALHQRLMWELEEERRSHSLPPELASRVVVRQGVEQERDGSTTKTPAFPDPFELGTLEVRMVWTRIVLTMSSYRTEVLP